MRMIPAIQLQCDAKCPHLDLDQVHEKFSRARGLRAFALRTWFLVGKKGGLV